MDTKRYHSYHINKYDIEISTPLFDSRIFWARVISSETESLFTQYTKHTFYEIQYALEGSIGMILGNNEHVLLERADFIVIPPDTYHQIVDGDSVGARFIMAFDIQPKNDLVAQTLKQLDTPIRYRESPAMRPLLSLILEKGYRDDLFCKGILNALIEGFLMEILETLTLMQNAVTGEQNTKLHNEQFVAAVLSFIRDYNGIGIGVSDLASHFHISERHLNRILQASTKRTAKELIHLEKIKRIERLTATTSLSLNEISELCGFSDEYAMNKFFKRHTKNNLSDFRKLVRQKSQAR